MGFEVLTGLMEDPKRPNNYIDGDILESKTAKTYKGKAGLSPDGKRLFIAIQTHMALHLQTVPNVQRLIQINPFWVWRFYLDLGKIQINQIHILMVGC